MYKDLEKRRKKQREIYHRLKSERPFHHKALYIKMASKRKGVDFDLDEDFLRSIWTGVCGISGLPIHLDNHRNEEDHAELDRIVPQLGYIRGNVIWLSRKYNRMKGDMAMEDSRILYEWFISLDRLKGEYGV